MNSSRTPPKTSSSNSTPPGADTANPLLLSGMSSEKNTRITKTSLSPSLMPLLTNSRMSKYKASQLLNFSQLEKELKWSTTTAAELSTISSNSSSQKLLRMKRKRMVPKRRPLMLVKTSSKYSQLST